MLYARSEDDGVMGNEQSVGRGGPERGWCAPAPSAPEFGARTILDFLQREHDEQSVIVTTTAMMVMRRQECYDV